MHAKAGTEFKLYKPSFYLFKLTCEHSKNNISFSKQYASILFHMQNGLKHKVTKSSRWKVMDEINLLDLTELF